MRIVDAHCHLDAPEFEGRLDRVLADGRAAGVVRWISAAAEPLDWAKNAAIAAAHPEVSFAWGIHPWFVDEAHWEQLQTLESARERGAVAIGEIGLDAKIAQPGMPLQQAFFERQLQVARALDLPVVIHCRGAFGELLESLKRVGTPQAGGVVHAFSGSLEIAEACMEFGLSFSMGASLSYKPSKKRLRVLERIYPDNFLIETDCPDMPPAQAPPGEPNVPAHIRYNLRGAAEMLGETEARVAEVTARNAALLFGFSFPETGRNTENS